MSVLMPSKKEHDKRVIPVPSEALFIPGEDDAGLTKRYYEWKRTVPPSKSKTPMTILQGFWEYTQQTLRKTNTQPAGG